MQPLFGPYRTPVFRFGDVVICEVRGQVELVGLTAGPVPWPVGKRGRVVTCRLRAEPFGELEGWLTDRRMFWTSALGRLGVVLDEEQP